MQRLLLLFMVEYKLLILILDNANRTNLFQEWIFFITGSSWPPDSNFTTCKCTPVQYYQILVNIAGIFSFKSHSGVLCGAFWNITFSSLLILTTVFKSNPKRLSISFYIPFVTWKMHYKHFWTKKKKKKKHDYDALSLYFRFSTFIYFSSSRIRSKELRISQEQPKSILLI